MAHMLEVASYFPSTVLTTPIARTLQTRPFAWTIDSVGGKGDTVTHLLATMKAKSRVRSIHGLSMVYLWSIYGLSMVYPMVYLWSISVFCTFLALRTC